MQLLLLLLGIGWASPYTLLGLILGTIGLASGGYTRVRSRAIEFHGGFVTWFVRHLPLGETTLAFTLGHTILGQTGESLDIAHNHEMVHVRQYEKWGPFMGIAYLGASCALWCIGRDPYFDNPFEREAYAIASSHKR